MMPLSSLYVRIKEFVDLIEPSNLKRIFVDQYKQHKKIKSIIQIWTVPVTLADNLSLKSFIDHGL